MAFVNEYLSKEEKEGLKVRAIPNPGNQLSIIDPSWWTIDREENVKFMWGCQAFGEDGDNMYYYLLEWKGNPIPLKLEKNWINGSTCEWGIVYLGISSDLYEKKNDIIQMLKNALTVYGYDGYPQDIQKIVVQFKF